MNSLLQEKTDDGSNTLYVPQLDEHYHSTKGAKTESQHIFIKEGLLHTKLEHIKVLEIGFGTGLNAFETLVSSQENKIYVDFHSLELFPLSWEDVKGLNYSESTAYKNIINAEWDTPTTIIDTFKLTKYHCDFTKIDTKTFTKDFDVIYFDAFAPEKQPEMWEQQLFNNLYVLLKDGGILTTYCAKGIVRRMLQESGFKVERIPGPPGGKREILRANK